MEVKAKFATIEKGKESLIVELLDEYPKWHPWRSNLLTDVKIEAREGFANIKGKQEICKTGTDMYGIDFIELENHEEYEEDSYSECEVKEWKFPFKMVKRKAFFATKDWVVKKVRPTIEITTSMFKIIDERQK